MVWKNKTVWIAAALLSLGLSVGCGDDNTASQENANENASENANTSQNNSDPMGSPSKSSFDVEVKDETGSKESVKEEQPNDQASMESWGASIAGSTLTITLVSSQGKTMTAVLETSEQKTAPGAFTMSAPPEGNHLTLLDALAGNSFESNMGGTITLTSCPRAVGAKATGRFDDVVLGSSVGNATRTISGEFDVAVFAKAGDLFCQTMSMENNTSDNNSSQNMNNTCALDQCADPDAVCCPFAQCIAQCQLTCLMSADCFGLNPDPIKCVACAEGCPDECNASAECKSAFLDLHRCEDRNGCYDAQTEEAEDQCVRDNCCAEANAAF